MIHETEMNLLTTNAVRCRISRSEPVEELSGTVTTWSTQSLTVMSSPRAGFRLNEPVVVRVDYLADSQADRPARFALFYSRVVSIVWQNAGEVLGLAIRAAKWPVIGRPKCQPRSRTPGRTVS